MSPGSVAPNGPSKAPPKGQPKAPPMAPPKAPPMGQPKAPPKAPPMAQPKPQPKGSNPPRFLKLEGTGVSKAPVGVVAGFSGSEPDERLLGEFRRRYGYSDYVVLSSKDTDGSVSGRVYAWTDGAAGVNAALNAAPAGAKGTVTDANGKVMYSGDLFIGHDFVEAKPLKVVPSPDGKFTAKLCAAGFDGANVVFVRNEATGKETRWQAGSRNGDLYLDAHWVGNGLLTFEGKPDDQLIYQLYDAGHYIREVLGPDQLRADAVAIGLAVSDSSEPKLLSTERQGDALRYRAEFVLADGSKLERAFKGRFEADQKGDVRLVDRVHE
ncbi:MAG: hypothetical protein FJZ00_01370 [Candidatus Sericytochromatia bacterium]|uniref:Uncharacterized protein n=1 Tax=Candidatus Tanganyikabacteria bacterium TaxID=2961651 RepID=A0A937X0N9_9BACT|nr:hypothetical protein [Candidatus Tanganyikabacteria bacterium]